MIKWFTRLRVKFRLLCRALTLDVDEVLQKAEVPQVKYRVTTDDSVSWEQDPTDPDPNELRFYRLKEDLGAFEIQQVVYRRGTQEAMVVIHNPAHEATFALSKKWFEYLFEPIVLQPIVIRHQGDAHD